MFKDAHPGSGSDINSPRPFDPVLHHDDFVDPPKRNDSRHPAKKRCSFRTIMAAEMVD